MTITTKLFSTKVAAAALAVAVVMGFALAYAMPAKAALSESQIQSILSLLSSFGADSSTINNVNASLRGQATTGTTGSTTTGGTSSCAFTKDLTVGSKGTDVTCLQNALIAGGYLAAGNNTGYFGALTQAAVAKWQAAAGVTPAAGYFGAKSRAAFGGTTTGGTTGGTTTTPAGSGLTVAAGTQPANSLAPQGAARVPFTRFTLTAGNDGDVVVNGVTIQRSGLADDSDFAGVILVDEATGQQLGNSVTFNSAHQAKVGGTFTVPRGMTKSYLLAGNMASSLAAHAGETPAISVVAINTSATVTGSLPITGAYQTTNATLSVGTITVTTSNAYAVNSGQTVNIGDTARKAAGFRLTAGSAEDITLKWLRFNQTGSVSAGDLANVAVVVNGTSYPLTVSSDGKYYAATLGSGIVIAKGNQVDVYVTYDITGTNSNSRTVIFDVDKNTDILAYGNTYGYGISPAVPSGSSAPISRTTTSVANFTTGTPFFQASMDTISGASVTTIGKANEVAAQNIAINVQNQPLGGFVVDLKGENMTVTSIPVTIASTSGSGAGLLTNVTLVDENGSVVAGPYDASYTNATTQTVTFSSSVTFKTGRHVYTIRGKVASTVGNGTVYTATTDPSTWGSPKGETSGNSIAISTASFPMNAVTVKSGNIVIGPATTPASQAIVSGGTQTLFANVQFDASQSGEDLRISSIPTQLTTVTVTPNTLTSCQVYNGSTALTTGSNVVNPSGSSPSTQTFTLDNPITIPKGTVVTLGIRCNVSGSVSSGSYTWVPGSTFYITGFTVTGAVSGTSLSSGSIVSGSASAGPTMTLNNGAATVALDASAPGYTVASAGTSGVTINALKFRASNEDVNLTKLGLALTNTASSSASDLVKISVYDGATKVGEAFFTAGSTVATSTFMSPVLLARDTDKVLTLKADFAAINSSAAVPFSGHLVAVDFRNAEGTGAASGATIYPSGNSTGSAGVRVFKSVPTFAQDILPSTGAADGRLLRFKVTADAAGPIGLTQFNFTLSTSTSGTLVTGINLFGYTDANYSQPITGVSTGGQLMTSNLCSAGCASNSPSLTVGAMTAAGASTTIQVPAGGTRWFELRGSITTVTGSSIVTTLRGDNAYPPLFSALGVNSAVTFMSTAGSTTQAFGTPDYPNGRVIWSPNSTTTSSRSDTDWTNGYGVNGLPASGIIQSRSN